MRRCQPQAPRKFWGSTNVLNHSLATYIKEDTFEKIEQRYDDFHYEIAETVRLALYDKYQMINKTGDVTNLMSDLDCDKLIVGLIKRRNNGELVADKYKIIIEKLVQV